MFRAYIDFNSALIFRVVYPEAIYHVLVHIDSLFTDTFALAIVCRRPSTIVCCRHSNRFNLFYLNPDAKMLNQIGLGRNKLILNVEETKFYIGCNWGINVKGQSRMGTHLLL